jgi:glycosyltransferase involved in cell wall biosynthesis
MAARRLALLTATLCFDRLHAVPITPPPGHHDGRWTVVVPFFNERALIGATLASLAAQDVPFHLIVVDNGSTDDSAAVATAVCRQHGLAFVLITEQRPGKVNALAAGIAQVRTGYVATCDADTLYPSDYLRQAGYLLDKGAVAAGACFVPAEATSREHRRAARRVARAAAVFPRQCHTGGAGQVFRAAALHQVGQFDPLRWGYVLEDHEIMHRVARVGKIAYGASFRCSPSPRDRDRASIRWTLFERLAYHFIPGGRRDWFFYMFPARRLAARQLTSDRIRERQFRATGDASLQSRSTTAAVERLAA